MAARRALRQDELPQWFAHVDEAFENTPRAYFERHFYNDPWRDIDGIRVAVTESVSGGDSTEIAGTVRVYVRRVLIDSKQVPCGAVGEVSTKKACRHRGVATALLQDAVVWMEEHGMVFSKLRAGPVAAPLYKRLGWDPVPCHYRVVQAPRSAFTYSADASVERTGLHCQPMDVLTNQEQLQRIMSIHKTYSGHFNGTFVRDHEEYWQKWMAYEFTREDAYSAVARTGEGTIEAYASCSIWKDDGSQSKGNGDSTITVSLIREFGVTDARMALDGGEAALLFLAQCLFGLYATKASGCGASGADREIVRLIYPAALENYFHVPSTILTKPAEGVHHEVKIDEHNMTRPLKPFNDTNASLHEALRRRPGHSPIPTATSVDNVGYFLFWETDAY